MSLHDAEEALLTRVGKVSPTEMHFMGREVGDLMTCNYWQLLSLSIGGPNLDAAACLVLDRLTACMQACDPRVWPLKVIHLAGCYGRPSTALGVGAITMELSPLSYWSAAPAAIYLRELRLRLAGQPLDGRSLPELADQIPPGFGVHWRQIDHRVGLFRVWRQSSEVPPGPYEQLIGELESQVVSQHEKHVHVAGLAGAVLSDLGFAPEGVGVVAGVLQALPSMLANAVEGSRRGPELRELRPGKIVYKGAAPRCSSRSLKSIR